MDKISFVTLAPGWKVLPGTNYQYHLNSLFTIGYGFSNIKLFYFSMKLYKKARVFVLSKSFQFQSIISIWQPTQVEHLKMQYSNCRLLDITTNIRLNWKRFSRTNTGIIDRGVTKTRQLICPECQWWRKSFMTMTPAWWRGCQGGWKSRGSEARQNINIIITHADWMTDWMKNA